MGRARLVDSALAALAASSANGIAMTAVSPTLLSDPEVCGPSSPGGR